LINTQARLSRSLLPLVLGLCVWLLWPAHAFARALGRFIHAVPGVGTATLRVRNGHDTVTLPPFGFGQSTPWTSLPSGRFSWTLTGGGKTLATGTSSVGNGAYDMVFLAEASGVSLGVYRARAGQPGTSLVRVIHAAPELGAPELELDSKVVVKSLSFTRATPYLSVSPGVHSLSAMKTGDTAPLISLKGVRLHPDVAYSGVVIGSRGQQVRVLTLTDRGGPSARPAQSGHGAATEPARHTGIVVVRRGDSLWLIAKRQLPAKAGNQAIERELVAIWDRNAIRIGTGNPNLIFTGQRLIVPPG
jgi:hypothetical protein